MNARSILESNHVKFAEIQTLFGAVVRFEVCE